MNLFCSKGGFHKYEYYIGPDPDGFIVECERCTKCGKIFGLNEVISNEFIYEERKREEEFFDNLKNEIERIIISVLLGLTGLADIGAVAWLCGLVVLLGSATCFTLFDDSLSIGLLFAIILT